MVFNHEIHHRKSIRFKGYDYSQDGVYFVTVCAQNRQCLFGKITDGEMKLNNVGEMVWNRWIDLKNRFPKIEIDEFIVMPNHFHGILSVGAGLVSALPELLEGMKLANKRIRADTRPAPTNQNADAKTLGDIICGFKSLTANEYIQNVKTGKFPPFEKSLWQRNYWEHIVRDDDDLNRIREYVIDNPINWKIDELFL